MQTMRRRVPKTAIGFPFVVPDPFGHAKRDLGTDGYTIQKGYYSQLSSISAMVAGLARFATFLCASLLGYVCWLRLQQPELPEGSDNTVRIVHALDYGSVIVQGAAVLVLLFQSVVTYDAAFGRVLGPDTSFLMVTGYPYYVSVAVCMLLAASIPTSDLSQVLAEYQFEVLFDELSQYFGTCERNLNAGLDAYCAEGEHISWVVRVIGYARYWLFAAGVTAYVQGLAQHAAVVFGLDFKYLHWLLMPTSVARLEHIVNKPLDNADSWYTPRWYDKMRGTEYDGRRSGRFFISAVRKTAAALLGSYVLVTLFLQLHKGITTYDWSYAGLVDALRARGDAACSDELFISGDCDPLADGYGVNESSSYSFGVKLLAMMLCVGYATTRLWYVVYRTIINLKYEPTVELTYAILVYGTIYIAVHGEKLEEDEDFFDGVTEAAGRLLGDDAVSAANVPIYMLLAVAIVWVAELIAWTVSYPALTMDFARGVVFDPIVFVLLNLPFPKILSTIAGLVLGIVLPALAADRSTWYYPFVGAVAGAALGVLVGYFIERVYQRNFGASANATRANATLANNKLWRVVYPVAIFICTWSMLVLLLGTFTELMSINFNVGGNIKALGQIVDVLSRMALGVIGAFVKVARLFNPCLNEIDPPDKVANERTIGLAPNTLDTMWSPVTGSFTDGGMLNGEQAYCFENGVYTEDPPVEGNGWFYIADTDDAASMVHALHRIGGTGNVQAGLWNEEEACDGVPFEGVGGTVVWTDKCSVTHANAARKINGMLYGRCLTPDTGEACDETSTTGSVCNGESASECNNHVECTFESGTCERRCSCFTLEWAPPTCRLRQDRHWALMQKYTGEKLSRSDMMDFICAKTYGTGSTCDSVTKHCTLPIPLFRNFNPDNANDDFFQTCPAQSYKASVIEHYDEEKCLEPIPEGAPKMPVTEPPPGQEPLLEGCADVYRRLGDLVTSNLLKSRNALRKMYSAAGVCCDEDGNLGSTGTGCVNVWAETSADADAARGPKIDESCSDAQCRLVCENPDNGGADTAECSCEGAVGSCKRELDLSSDTGLTISYNSDCLKDACKAANHAITATVVLFASSLVTCVAGDLAGIAIVIGPFDFTGAVCSKLSQLAIKAIEIAAKAMWKVFKFGKTVGRGIMKMITKRKALTRVANALGKMIGAKATKLLFKSSMNKAFVAVWMTSGFAALTGFWHRERRKPAFPSLLVASGLLGAAIVNMILFLILFGVSGLVENASTVTGGLSPSCTKYNGRSTVTTTTLCGNEIVEPCNAQTCQAPKRCNEQLVVAPGAVPPDYEGCVADDNCAWYGNRPPVPIGEDPADHPDRELRTCPPPATYAPTPPPRSGWEVVQGRRCGTEVPLRVTSLPSSDQQRQRDNTAYFVYNGGIYDNCGSNCKHFCAPNNECPTNIPANPFDALYTRENTFQLCAHEHCRLECTDGGQHECNDAWKTDGDYHTRLLDGKYVFVHLYNDFDCHKDGCYYGRTDNPKCCKYKPYNSASYWKGKVHTRPLNLEMCKTVCNNMNLDKPTCGGFEISTSHYKTAYPEHFYDTGQVYCRFFSVGECMGDQSYDGEPSLIVNEVPFFGVPLTNVYIHENNFYAETTTPIYEDTCYEPYELNPGTCVYDSRMNDAYLERGVFLGSIDDIFSVLSRLGVEPGERSLISARAELLPGADMVKWGLFLNMLSCIVLAVYYIVSAASQGDDVVAAGTTVGQMIIRSLQSLWDRCCKRKSRKKRAAKVSEVSSMRLNKVTPKVEPKVAPIKATAQPARGDPMLEAGMTFGGWLLGLLVLLPAVVNIVKARGNAVGWDDGAQVDNSKWLGLVERGPPLRLFTFTASNSATANSALRDLSESEIFADASGNIANSIDDIGCAVDIVDIIFRKLLVPLLASIGRIDFGGLIGNVDFGEIGIDLDALGLDVSDLVNIHISGIDDLKRFWTNIFSKMGTIAAGFWKAIAVFKLDNPLAAFDFFAIFCEDGSESNNWHRDPKRNNACIYKYPYRTALSVPPRQYLEQYKGQFIEWSADGVNGNEPCLRDAQGQCVGDVGLFDGKFTNDTDDMQPCPKRCMPGVPYYQWEFFVVNMLPILYIALVAVGTVIALTYPSNRDPAEAPSDRMAILTLIRSMLFPLALVNMELIVALMALIELFGGVEAVLFEFHVGYGEGATNAMVSSVLMLASAAIINFENFWAIDG